jgi:hypothetical protein
MLEGERDIEIKTDIGFRAALLCLRSSGETVLKMQVIKRA